MSLNEVMRVKTDINRPLVAWLPHPESGELIQTFIVGRDEIAMVRGWSNHPWDAGVLHRDLRNGNTMFDNCEMRYATDEECKAYGLYERREAADKAHPEDKGTR